MTNSTAAKATEKQLQFLLKIVNEDGPKAKTYVDTQLAANHVTHPRDLSKSEISNVIQVLLDERKNLRNAPTTTFPTPTAKPEPEAGVYRSTEDGTLLRVYRGQQSGKMLAKEIGVRSNGEVGYEYLGAATRFLNDTFTRLTLAEVGELGKKWGNCLICGRDLDDPESVDRGVGPVCAARYGIADKKIELPK